jgi:hypothetical protein
MSQKVKQNEVIIDKVRILFFLFTYVFHKARFRKPKVCTIFLHFFFFQISFSKFWVERKIQASAQTLSDIKFTPNSLNVLLHFSFDILTVVPIYCCAAVQAFSKIQEEFSDVVRIVSQYQKSYILLSMRSLLQQFTHNADICIHCMNTLLISAREFLSLLCKCCERYCSDVKCNVRRQSTIEIQNARPSAW